MQGVFEYMGKFQEQKFAEINDLLKADGRLVATYVNFNHRAPSFYWPYNNIQPLRDFRASLARSLTIEKYFPTSHNWNHSEPRKPLVQALQIPVRLPVLSQYLAVEYFFICSRGPRRSSSTADQHVRHRPGTAVGARTRRLQPAAVGRRCASRRPDTAVRTPSGRRHKVLPEFYHRSGGGSSVALWPAGLPALSAEFAH